MDAKKRVKLCRMIWKINQNKEAAKRIGIEDASYFLNRSSSQKISSIIQGGVSND
ncbi:MAG: hypothetical protein K6F30_06625 [Lachnospiraceae bacterium]|nr:hypothetical protein [Lachnospiraceae bacterium]